MSAVRERTYQVNELTPDPAVVFDPKIGTQYLRHLRPSPGGARAGLQLERRRPGHAGAPSGLPGRRLLRQGAGHQSSRRCRGEDLIITDVPWGRILYGDRATTVGHQMNREILRLRPDVNAVIHLHHDETIAFMAAGLRGASASPA